MCEVRLCVNDIRKRIKQMLEEKLPHKCVRIYKAPLVLAHKNKGAYTPKLVSVGPFHHKAAHLSSDMYTQKVRAVNRMMSRLSSDRPNMSTFDKMVKKMQKSEIKIRELYETDIEYDGEYLACMMALDGCFVLEVLLCLSQQTPVDDPFFNRHKIEYASYSLLTDILLLENQIPLFVLISLLKMERGTKTEAKRKLSEMIVNDREVGRLFYPFVFEEEEWSHQVRALTTGEDPEHLLDLAIRLARGDCSGSPPHCQQVDAPDRQGNENCLPIPTATELKEAGIRFETCKGGLTMVDFSYAKSTLRLPRINVTASAGIFLRNLMAYEICRYPHNRVVSNFAVLMDELINTETDVALLRKQGIIHSYTLGTDKDVASFFNDLRKGTVGSGSSSVDTFRTQREDLLRCYRRKYRVMFAEFVRLHFSKPWRAASVTAAVMLLILTLLQTIYTVKGA